jgi:hypothetical protein
MNEGTRIGNISFRTTRAIGPNQVEYCELVKWEPNQSTEGEYCYTLAKWDIGSEDYYLSFCGNRPFDLDSAEQLVFWQLANYGQKLMDAAFVLAGFAEDNS